MDVSLTYANQLKGLLAKADGKDKFIALLQYAAMFASAGEPGAFLAAQKSLSAARKPFRVFKPVEFLMPLVERPPKGKGLGACLAYVSVPPRGRRTPENLRRKATTCPEFSGQRSTPRRRPVCVRARNKTDVRLGGVPPLIHARLVL
jgi:hypothetical protein